MIEEPQPVEISEQDVKTSIRQINKLAVVVCLYII